MIDLLRPQARQKEDMKSLDQPLILDDELNHRQIQALRWLKGKEFVGVNDYKRQFKTSEITALRDLKGLLDKKRVLRIGKARSTKYRLFTEA